MVCAAPCGTVEFAGGSLTLASTVHGQARDRDIDAIPGSPPDLRRLPVGCAFAPRCPRAGMDCRTGQPAERHPEPGRMARCLRVAESVFV